jgi:hypothetical protein
MKRTDPPNGLPWTYPRPARANGQCFLVYKSNFYIRYQQDTTPTTFNLTKEQIRIRLKALSQVGPDCAVTEAPGTSATASTREVLGEHLPSQVDGRSESLAPLPERRDPVPSWEAECAWGALISH